METSCQFPFFLSRKCFLYLVSWRGRDVERWEEQKIIQRKEFTNHKVSIPGFNLMFSSWFFLDCGQSWHLSEKTVILHHRAQTLAYSNGTIVSKEPMYRNDSRSQLFLVITQKEMTVQIHSDIKVCLSQQSFRQGIWSRKWHAWKEKFILEMHLQASEKIKGTQYLTLLLPLYNRKASASKAQSILITLFLCITFNKAPMLQFSGEAQKIIQSLKNTQLIQDSNGPWI